MDHSNPTFAKIPILDIGKFEQWKFRIQQYLQNEHYALWEVIEFDDSYKALLVETGKCPASESSARKNERTVAITMEDMQKRRNDVKARTNLLLALPDEHQLRFSKYEIPKEFGKGEVYTVSVPTASIQVSTASTDVAAASLSHDTIYKNKEGLGYSAVHPPHVQIYSPPKKDLSWTGLPEFVDDIVTDYLREIHKITLMIKDIRTVVSLGGKITGKGIIKTGKLEFENVYFMKELKYNLFSVSQICDNKNSVMFTDSEYLVLGKDFKLNDDTNVLLRTPRQHSMYSIDLNNIVPHKNLICLVAKASVDKSRLWHRKKHKASCKTKLVNSVSKPLHTLHMDLFGPTSISSLNHKWYCLVVTDDFSRCDNREEFKNQEMNEFCTKKVIRREFSNARTPQQNKVAERMNRTLIEATRTMLADAKLLITFWAEVVNTACYFQNRVLVNKSQNKTPYELFNSRIPAIGFLRPFRYHVMILNTLDHLGKFDAKRDEGYFVRYSLSSKAFRVFNKKTKKVKVNLHVDFLENKLIEKGAGTKDVASQAVKKDVSSLRYIALPNCGISNPTATSKVPSGDQVEPAVSLTVEYDILTVSSPVPTVCLDISLESLSGPKLISKGVFSQKETPSLGNALTLSNRFEDTFGDTTNAVTLNEVEADLSNIETSIQEEPKKIFNALKDPSWVEAMQEELLQFKIHNVWVLVDCPKGVRPIGTKWVLKNKKDERGNVTRNKARLVAQGYTQEEGIDYEEVFAPVARIKSIRLFLTYASFMGFIIYQMDIKNAFLYGTIDEKLCREFEALMHDKFQMSAMGELTFFLGLRVLQKKDGIFLSQDKYVGDILKKFGYSDVRPDIMFAVYACTRHQVTPKECHLHVVKRIFRYLKGHPKLGLWYPKESPFNLVAYSDSDYGGATQDRKSTTRGCQFLGKRLISWRHLKLNDEEGISSLLDVELFENISLMGYNILPSQRRLTKRAIQIAQSKALSPDADEPASLLRDDRHREAFPTVSSLDAGQDRENIAKTSTMSHESSPRVTSLNVDEGNIGEELGADKSTKKGSNDTEEMVAREMEEEFARENQRLIKQVARDSKIARINAEEELKLMIEGLDRSNEVITKHLSEYEQAKADLSVGEKIELISDLLVPLEEVYIEALQVKHPIIDWEIHTEGKREYWKIIRLGGHTGAYQFFVDMLNQFDRDALHQLWILVKETLSIKQYIRDKEKELWVELKRLFEPDSEDQLWTYH
nr:hypothetical protein [Tanacetum cinerariifolium]